MKAQLACIPCIMKQAYNTAIRATDDPKLIRRILNLTAEYVRKVDLDTTPADASYFAYQVTREITGITDPYREDKKSHNDMCLRVMPGLRDTIVRSEDPVRKAVSVSILGNVIDMGIGFSFDLEYELEKLLTVSFAIDDYDRFASQLAEGRKNILYIGDNAGEIVFDMLLVEQLIGDHDVTFVVKKGPIINDAMLEDAEYTGLAEIVTVIDTGSDGIGVKWNAVSDEFTGHFEDADLVIAKGQGNFETMSEIDKDIYFLLKAKCDSVAEKLGVSFGEIVFRKGPVA